MADFLGVDIAGIIDDTFTDLGIEDAESAVASLVKVTPGTRTPGAEAAGTNPTSTTYPVRGFVARRLVAYTPQSNVVEGDRQIIVFGASVAAGVEIVANDRIIDAKGKIWRVVSAVLDPAGAVWKVHGR
jgi:hypothetical protein